MKECERKLVERTNQLVEEGHIVVNDEGMQGYEIFFKRNGVVCVWRMYDTMEVLRIIRVLGSSEIN